MHLSTNQSEDLRQIATNYVEVIVWRSAARFILSSPGLCRTPLVAEREFLGFLRARRFFKRLQKFRVLVNSTLNQCFENSENVKLNPGLGGLRGIFCRGHCDGFTQPVFQNTTMKTDTTPIPMPVDGDHEAIKKYCLDHVIPDQFWRINYSDGLEADCQENCPKLRWRKSSCVKAVKRVYRGLNLYENPKPNERRYTHESLRSPHLRACRRLAAVATRKTRVLL
jgi:hypothetical protein